MMDKRKKCSLYSDVLLGEDASHAQDWICECDEEVDPTTGLSYDVIDEAMRAT
uniref:Uncharacterized protein n=1 Tax=Arundo donax TaxID=35708 RepID=A0A0A8Z895_ARUDO